MENDLDMQIALELRRLTELCHWAGHGEKWCQENGVNPNNMSDDDLSRFVGEIDFDHLVTSPTAFAFEPGFAVGRDKMEPELDDYQDTSCSQGVVIGFRSQEPVDALLIPFDGAAALYSLLSAGS